jgi:integrin beta 3
VAEPNPVAKAVWQVMRGELAPLLTELAVLKAAHAAVLERLARLETLGERVAVVETRAPLPGPAGAPGKDGADGLGVDDLAIDYDNERTVTFRAVRGDRVTDFGQVVLPMLIHRGVWTAGQAYVRGDVVSHGGGAWHCQTATSVERPETLGGAPYWKLIVKRGDRGKDAR